MIQRNQLSICFSIPVETALSLPNGTVQLLINTISEARDPLQEDKRGSSCPFHISGTIHWTAFSNHTIHTLPINRVILFPRKPILEAWDSVILLKPVLLQHIAPKENQLRALSQKDTFIILLRGTPLGKIEADFFTEISPNK